MAIKAVIRRGLAIREIGFSSEGQGEAVDCALWWMLFLCEDPGGTAQLVG